jgi:hypothetical protein
MEFHAPRPLLGSCFLKSDALLPLAAKAMGIPASFNNLSYLR